MLGASVILVLGLLIYGGILFLFVLLVMALLKYLRTKNTAPEERLLRRSLGEVIKAHRESCRMTQEFVAESLGVSRQAVSKWETGASDPSTSNLFALARLFGVRAEDLLREVEQ